MAKPRGGLFARFKRKWHLYAFSRFPLFLCVFPVCLLLITQPKPDLCARLVPYSSSKKDWRLVDVPFLFFPLEQLTPRFIVFPVLLCNQPPLTLLLQH